MVDDAATIDQLETRSMTSTSMSTMDNLLQPHLDDRFIYRNYRQGVYNNNLPITAYRERVSVNCLILNNPYTQFANGCREIFHSYKELVN